MTLNIANIPLKAAKLYPEAAAILAGSHSISYQQLKAQILTCAAALSQQGLSPGEHIALMLPNVPQFTISYFGVIAMGAAVVPLNVLFVEDEILYHLQDSDAKALIVWEGFLDKALAAAQKAGCKVIVCRTPQSQQALPDNTMDLMEILGTASKQGKATSFEPYPSHPDDTAVLLYTSGTTGRPKGAELSQFNMYDNARFVSEKLTRTEYTTLQPYGPGDVALAALPLFHSFGQTVIQNAFLMNGAAISLLPRFTPTEAAQLIQAHKVTFFAGVPAMYIGLLNDPDVKTEQFATLKYAVSGGAALPVEILKEFKKRFGINILEGYGLSETSPVACFNSLLQEQKPGTVGPAIDLCDVKIVGDNDQEVALGEKGEIVIRGTNVMKGYYKRAEATREVLFDGWFHTGDVGTMDEDGFVTIVDRKKDMIIRGGYNVYPREVEEVLYTHPDITEAAVIGIADDVHGEEVMAVVALKENSQLNHDELEQYCRQHIAAYKVPRKSLVMDALPKGPTGKIMKRLIKQQILDQHVKTAQ